MFRSFEWNRVRTRRTHVELIIVSSEPVEKEMPIDLVWAISLHSTSSELQFPAQTHLRLDQNQVDKQNHKVILDVFIGKALAPRALRQAYAFSQGSIVGAAVRAIQMRNWVGALDADRHVVLLAHGTCSMDSKKLKLQLWTPRFGCGGLFCLRRR